MPRDYGKIRHRFWTGETGRDMRAMGPEVRVVAAYLMTCGSSNMIGLYYLPLTLISHETGIPLEGASKALRRLGELEFAFYEHDAEVVFVPHMAREQIAESLSPNDKQRGAIIAQLTEYKKSRYYNEFLALYRDSYHLESLPFNEDPSEDLASPFEAPSKPENREQRTESREQDPPKAPQGGERKPKRAPKTVGSEAFEAFWAAYPAHRHVEKAEAIKSWPGDEVAPAIMAALSWQTRSHDWTKEGGSFVPHPKRYLAKRRWEDEPPRQGTLIPIKQDPRHGHSRAEDVDWSNVQTGEAKL